MSLLDQDITRKRQLKQDAIELNDSKNNNKYKIR